MTSSTSKNTQQAKSYKLVFAGPVGAGKTTAI